MKKHVITTFIAALVCINTTSCSPTSNTNESAEKKENYQIAIEKITEYLSNYEDITSTQRIADEAILKASSIETCVTTTTDLGNSDDYVLWAVNQKEDDVTIFFLFEQDKYIIAANQLKDNAKLLGENMLVNKDFMEHSDDKNYVHGGFAWEEDDADSTYAYALLNGEAKYDCSSIWAFDEVQKNISLVWYDVEDVAWKDYVKYTG